MEKGFSDVDRPRPMERPTMMSVSSVFAVSMERMGMPAVSWSPLRAMVTSRPESPGHHDIEHEHVGLLLALNRVEAGGAIVVAVRTS